MDTVDANQVIIGNLPLLMVKEDLLSIVQAIAPDEVIAEATNLEDGHAIVSFVSPEAVISHFH